MSLWFMGRHNRSKEAFFDFIPNKNFSFLIRRGGSRAPSEPPLDPPLQRLYQNRLSSWLKTDELFAHLVNRSFEQRGSLAWCCRPQKQLGRAFPAATPPLGRCWPAADHRQHLPSSSLSQVVEVTRSYWEKPTAPAQGPGCTTSAFSRPPPGLGSALPGHDSADATPAIQSERRTNWICWLRFYLHCVAYLRNTVEVKVLLSLTALIAVSLALSQTPANTARPRIRAVCLFTSHLSLVLIVPTHGGMARLSWPGWLVIYQDNLPVRQRSPIEVLTRPGID